jgi:hypothetical protein
VLCETKANVDAKGGGPVLCGMAPGSAEEFGILLDKHKWEPLVEVDTRMILTPL